MWMGTRQNHSCSRNLTAICACALVLATGASGQIVRIGQDSYRAVRTGASRACKVSLVPSKANLQMADTQQFRATVANAQDPSVSWSMAPSIGSLSTDGLYAAPLFLFNSLTVRVTAASVQYPNCSASATVTLKASTTVSVSPTVVQLGPDQSRQFTATVDGTLGAPVNWKVSPAIGSISSTGLYTAPVTLSGSQTATVTATSAVDATASATASVILQAPPEVAVSVFPASAQITANHTLQLSATVSGATNTAVIWSVGGVPGGNATVGAITSAGLFTAPAAVPSPSTVTVTATSAEDPGKSASALLTIVSEPTPLVVVTPSLPVGTVGTPYGATITASGGTAPYMFSLAAGQLPAGLSLSVSGSLSGTPSAANSSSVTIQVQDSGGQTASQVYTLSVVAPFSIVTASLPAGVVGTAYSTTVAATGGAAPYTFVVGLPEGLSISATTGQISGTPSMEGTYNVTVEATDAGGRKATKSLSLMIAAALAITTTSLPDGVAGVAYVGAVAAVGGTAPLSWAIASGQLPSGLGLDPASGAITGRPATGGAYTFSAQVRDSAGQQASRTLTIAVTGGGASPAILTNSLSLGYIQQPYSALMTAAGGTAPYTWSLAAGQLPAGLALEAASGKITGTPTAGGQFSATITAKDSNDASASKTFTLEVFEQQTDKYGGLVSNPCPGGPKAHFYTQKIGSRWSFCTPDGNGYFMLGVFNLTVSNSVDDMGGNYADRILRKYGSIDTWATQQPLRLKSWGFNAVAEYSDWRVWNKIPSVHILNAASYSLTNRWSVGTQPVKNILAGVDAAVYETNGRAFTDVFDPAFEAYLDGYLRTNTPGLASMYPSPWIVGISTDDRDELFGFGPGPDLPAYSVHPHLGWLSLVTNFQQTSNASLGVTYSDRSVYTKLALRDFLQSKYGTITALNAAWGADYTSWDSAGGWGSGTGLLDEAGSNSWVCRDAYGLSGCNVNLKADADEFLYRLAKKYFSVYKAKINQYAPGVLVFGPATLNSDGVTRGPIFKAAGEEIDVVQASFQKSYPSNIQAQINYVAQYLGDHPILSYEILKANPDSALFRYPLPSPCTWCASTQEKRGGIYQDDLTAEVNLRVTQSGVYPIAGVQYWEFHDNWGEKGNYGLVSLSDNGYDGQEARVAAGNDSWGYPTGGEEKDYGDFLGSVKSTHKAIRNLLTGNSAPSN